MAFSVFCLNMLLIVLELFIDIEIFINSKYADIHNVGYNINIETHYKIDASLLTSINIKCKI